MLDVVLAVLPVFVVLVLGLFLRKRGIIDETVWIGLDKLVYWVLFPAMLFNKTSAAPIGGDVVGSYALILLPGIFISGLVIWGFAAVSSLPRPALSSVYQGATRHNSYIGFAVVTILLGEDGLLMAALATALMVPFVNVLCVGTLVTLHGPKDGSSLARRLLREIFRNPLIVSILAGIAWNMVGLGKVPVIATVLDMLTVAALPVALLGVGAGLRLRAIRTAAVPLVLSAVCKFAILPAVVTAGLILFGIKGTPAVVAVIFASLPTAASGYALARQLGGDTTLAAGLITVQTFISVFSLPLVIVLLGGYFT